ncbi:glycerophosphodiester phosphodiesterase [Bacillus sp. FJAT-42376]|uniref:glycerophosphodiester phosphodiesterase n=1 Tax=Bacillus sp. FJAT-42376 TaxID=2014076 RepID=UPI000F4F192B|nr:glycerophosphodiester phosphodiesterase family protein [Bacillus sp. FJAT-42376]AZB41656.1 glycerophosphodiester phosphodiesterase [Bacillus sp. FJAT-42376]
MKNSFLILCSVILTGLLLSHAVKAYGEPVTGGAENNMLTIAHRGASGYAPENTKASFDKALEIGTDLIEFDVQRTRDGELVVIHDTSVNRTTNGSGEVRDLLAADLKKLDAGSWFSPEFKGERIMTFSEVLKRYNGKAGMLIELKSPSLYPGIEQQVAEELAKYPLSDKVVQSFEQESMKKMHRILPYLQIGVLMKYRPLGIPVRQLEEMSDYASFINPNKKLVNRGLVQKIHALGMKITPYTVRDRASAASLKKMEVDGIISDYPDYINDIKREE